MIEQTALFFVTMNTEADSAERMEPSQVQHHISKLTLDCQVIDEDFEGKKLKYIKIIICMNTNDYIFQNLMDSVI